MKGMQKISRGTGFRGVLDYAFADRNAIFLGASDLMMGRDAADLSRDFHHVLALRQQAGRYVWHSSLRLPPGEHVSRELILDFAHTYMSRMGLDRKGALYAVILHDEPDGQHVHIVASRVLANGELWLGKNENLISTRVIHELEKEFGLTITKGVEYSESLDEKGQKRHRVLKPGLKRAKRGELKLNERLANELGIGRSPREELLKILDSAIYTRSVERFLCTAEAHGVQISANVASTGKVSGLAFGYGGQIFKGSSLGSRYGWSQLGLALNYSADRDLLKLRERAVRIEDTGIAGDAVRVPVLVDLPGPPVFWARPGPDSSVRYIRQSTRELAMTDTGSRITFRVQDYDTLDAGLQLANKKWPEGFRISGSPTFKLLLVERAVALGVAGKILNDDLDEEIAAAICRRQRRIVVDEGLDFAVNSEQIVGIVKAVGTGSAPRRSMVESSRPSPAIPRKRTSEVEATKEDSDIAERIKVRRRVALAIRRAELAARLVTLTTLEHTGHLRLDATPSQAYLALAREYAASLPPTADAMDPPRWRAFDRERAAPWLLERFGSTEVATVLTRMSPAAVRTPRAVENQALRSDEGAIIKRYGSDLVAGVLNESIDQAPDAVKRHTLGKASIRRRET